MDKYTKIVQLLDQIYLKHNKCSPYFRGYNKGWLNCQCPYHKDGHESHPSFGINVNEGVYNCFSCSQTGTVEGLAFDFDIEYDSTESSRESIIFVDTDVIEDRVTNNQPGFIESDLIRQQKIWTDHTHNVYLINTRGISPEVVQRVLAYQTDNEVRFPVFDMFGDPSFIAKRSLNNKRFYIQTGVDLPLYLGNIAYRSNKRIPLYITEGPIDALSIMTMGGLAVALFGLGSKNQIELLKELPQEEIILAMDNDEAGRNASIKLYSKLKSVKKIKVLKYPNDECKDPNQLLLESNGDYMLKEDSVENLLFTETRPTGYNIKGRSQFSFT